MAIRSREWWRYATPDQRRGLEAADFRRTAEAALFKAGVTDDGRSLPDFLQEYMDAQRANPLAPKSEVLESRPLPQPIDPDEELAAPRGPDLGAPVDPERERRRAIADEELAVPRGAASQDDILAQASERFAVAERAQPVPAVVVEQDRRAGIAGVQDRRGVVEPAPPRTRPTGVAGGVRPPPAPEPAPNLQPLSVERTREELATTRPGLPREQAMDLDARLRHVFPESPDVSSLDTADLFSEFGEAQARLEELEDRTGVPVDLVEGREIRERAQRAKDAVSLIGPLTESDRGGLAQLLGVPLGALAEIPGGEQVLRRLAVEGELLFGDITREEAERRFDEMWESWPRWLQLVAEETFDPTNALIVAGGAVIAPRLLASSSRTARILGKALEPISKGPLAFPSEVGAAVGLRGAFEASEGAPLAVRLPLAAVGAVVGAGSPSAIRAGARQAPDIARVAGEIVQTARRPGELLPGEAVPRAEIIPGAGGALGDVDPLDLARGALRRIVDEEAALRARGIPEAEIHQARGLGAEQIRQKLIEAREISGITEREAAGAARPPRGRQRQTLPAAPDLTRAEMDVVFRELNDMLLRDEIPSYIHTNMRDAFEKAFTHQQLEPREANLIRAFLGDSVGNAVVGEAASPGLFSVARPRAVTGRQLPSTGTTLPGGPRGITATGQTRGARTIPQPMRVDVEPPRPTPSPPPPPGRPRVTPAAATRRLPSGTPSLPVEPRAVTSAGAAETPLRPGPAPPITAAEVTGAVASRNRLVDAVIETFGFVKSFKSSFDVSAPGRQGWKVLFRRPDLWIKAWGPAIKALASEDAAQATQALIQSGPAAARRNAKKVFFAELGDPNLRVRKRPDGKWEVFNRETKNIEPGLFDTKAEAQRVVTPDFTQREEQFLSRVASKFLPIRMSERHFVVYLNKLRADFFDTFAAKLDEQFMAGKLTREQWDRELDALGSLTNLLTGRGNIPESIAGNDIMNALGQSMFSMRYQLANIQSITTIFDPRIPLQARRLVAETMGLQIGLQVTALKLGQEFGWWDVELDPRSSDFLKIRILGKELPGVGAVVRQRIDPWAGLQPIIVFAARMATGDLKALDQDEVTPLRGPLAGRWEAMLRASRNRLTPVLGFAADAFTGEDFAGRPISIEQAFIDMIAPLSPTDIKEGFDIAGIKGAGLGAIALGGPGVQSFQTETNARDEAAFDLFPELNSTFDGLPAIHPDDPQVNPRREVLDDPRVEAAAAGRTSEFQERREAAFQEQKLTDGQLAAGTLSIDQWKAVTDRRRAEGIGAAEAEFGTDPIPDPKNAWERYINKTRELVTDLGEPNWDRIDGWQATLSDEDNQLIFSRSGMSDTPFLRRRRIVSQQLEETEFWDIRTEAWADFLKFDAPLDEVGEMRGFDDFSSWERLWKRRKQRELQQQGLDEGFAQQQAERDFTAEFPGLRSEWNALLNQFELPWVQDHTEDGLADEATAVGYFRPTIEQTEAFGGPLFEAPALTTPSRRRTRSRRR